VTARERAESRERRRAAARARDGDSQEERGDNAISDGLLQAARTAAAAAAVGAAVGAARTLAGRGADDGHEAKHEEPEPENDGEEQPEPDGDEPEQQPERPRRTTPRGAAPERVRSIAQRARDQLRDLVDREAEQLSSLERTGDGWRVTLEVLELARVPDSTDVLATYVVELDGDGDLVRYERLRRYYRAQSDLGDGA